MNTPPADQHALLRQKGLRHTPVRETLFTILSETPHGADVPTLVGELTRRGFAVNKTTVYRQLTTLASHGIVTAMPGFDGITKYELTYEGHHHHHFICTSCRAIEPIETDVIEGELSLIERTLKRRGFHVADHALELFGTCPKCH